MHRIVLFVTLLFPVLSTAASAVEAITLNSLLAEMVDRDHLARLPAHPFQCLQASSYDRAQTDPKNPDTWFANHDYEQFIRTETNDGRKEWVIVEHEGPGAITRFWIPLEASRNNQVIRFYFDGANTPEIAVKINDLFRGRLFVKPPFAFVASDEKAIEGVAGDLYLPIPFGKGCKITLDSLPFYYNINYRAYDKGIEVKTFTMGDLERNMQLMVSRFALQKELGIGWIWTPSKTPDNDLLKPGAEAELDLPEGMQVVERLVVSIHANDAPQVLRTAVITASFDGENTICCPLSEFFGCGVRVGPVTDFYRNVAKDGTLSAKWLMPYSKSGRIVVKNVGNRPCHITINASVRPWYWDNRSMHFHATWRHQYPIETKKATGTMDWNYLEATGQGVCVGDTLTVFSPSKAWYGEGDERVYIDGGNGKLPQHMGTGTEDYYGYAWGMARQFSSPFLSMPRRDGTARDDWRGYTTTSRVRLLDEIPFQRSLKFDMEVWDWEATKLGYSAATFWYARPGATCNRKPMPEAAASTILELAKP